MYLNSMSVANIGLVMGYWDPSCQGSHHKMNKADLQLTLHSMVDGSTASRNSKYFFSLQGNLKVNIWLLYQPLTEAM